MEKRHECTWQDVASKSSRRGLSHFLIGSHWENLCVETTPSLSHSVHPSVKDAHTQISLTPSGRERSNSTEHTHQMELTINFSNIYKMQMWARNDGAVPEHLFPCRLTGLMLIACLLSHFHPSRTLAGLWVYHVSAACGRARHTRTHTHAHVVLQQTHLFTLPASLLSSLTNTPAYLPVLDPHRHQRLWRDWLREKQVNDCSVHELVYRASSLFDCLLAEVVSYKQLICSYALAIKVSTLG